jgi:TPP-dependent pyruvate/acetoin dehydrogenase alpha subunit
MTLLSGVDAGKVMAELYGRDGGACRGTGGSMHIYDVEHNFQARGSIRTSTPPTMTLNTRTI